MSLKDKLKAVVQSMKRQQQIDTKAVERAKRMAEAIAKEAKRIREAR